MIFLWVLGSGIVFFTLGWFLRAKFYPSATPEDLKHLQELIAKLKQLDPVQ